MEAIVVDSRKPTLFQKDWRHVVGAAELQLSPLGRAYLDSPDAVHDDLGPGSSDTASGRRWRVTAQQSVQWVVSGDQHLQHDGSVPVLASHNQPVGSSGLVCMGEF